CWFGCRFRWPKAHTEGGQAMAATMSRLIGDGGGAGRDLRTRSEPKLIGNKIA
ncbi:unnamed protein product, partial [Musa acuminata subsp. burmannicoides]